jgi:hypothetical protein
MVSLNMFATPTEAQITGGGLHIWQVFPKGMDHLSFNKQFGWDQKDLDTIRNNYDRITIPWLDGFSWKPWPFLIW